MRRILLQKAALAAGALVRRSGRGGGTALPGLLIERTDPGLITELAARLDGGVVLVSGTNGKTTTAGLLATALRDAGRAVVHNRAGSNLVRGIAAALVQDRPVGAAGAVGLFEVDEATLPAAIELVRPRLVVLLNLFRDQLDRYGEVDTIAQGWAGAIGRLPAAATLVLNADDPVVAALGAGFPGRVICFGVDDALAALDRPETAADLAGCARCRGPLAYDLRFYGHLGHYRCEGCGAARPQPEVRAVTARARGLQRVALSLAAGNETVDLNLPLPGLYNAYNLLAAAAAGRALDLPLSAAAAAAQGASAVFGRGEAFEFEGRRVVMLLVKNPVGANQVLRAVAGEPGGQSLLVVLNDLLADGEDVSWIWDVDFEMLAGRVRSVVAAGRRAADMALRLKYAGWSGPGAAPDSPPVILLPGIEAALRTAVYRTPPGATLYVLPTYTAMLALRRLLTSLSVVRPFWEGEA